MSDFVAIGYQPYDDPKLFEMAEYSHTDLKPTVQMTVEELVTKFQANKGNW